MRLLSCFTGHHDLQRKKNGVGVLTVKVDARDQATQTEGASLHEVSRVLSCPVLTKSSKQQHLQSWYHPLSIAVVDHLVVYHDRIHISQAPQPSKSHLTLNTRAISCWLITHSFLLKIILASFSLVVGLVHACMQAVANSGIQSARPTGARSRETRAVGLGADVWPYRSAGPSAHDSSHHDENPQPLLTATKADLVLGYVQLDIQLPRTAQTCTTLAQIRRCRFSVAAHLRYSDRVNHRWRQKNRSQVWSGLRGSLCVCKQLLSPQSMRWTTSRPRCIRMPTRWVSGASMWPTCP
jgi:hypothetical protein